MTSDIVPWFLDLISVHCSESSVFMTHQVVVTCNCSFEITLCADVYWYQFLLLKTEIMKNRKVYTQLFTSLLLLEDRGRWRLSTTLAKWSLDATFFFPSFCGWLNNLGISLVKTSFQSLEAWEENMRKSFMLFVRFYCTQSIGKDWLNAFRWIWIC